MHPYARKSLTGFLGFVAVAGAVALFRDTLSQGQDFDVFWNAARAVMSGERAYDLARDGGMVFKYPPWILPVFFPLAKLPLDLAKGVWASIELGCIGLVFAWLLRAGCAFRPTALAVLLFWGVWAVHALDGQVSLLVLVLSLWAWEGMRRGPVLRELSSVVLVWALSTKVFSAFSLLGVRSGFKRWTSLSRILIVLGILSVPLVMTSETRSPQGLVREWVSAARSGNYVFEGEKVRARENQGLPAMILRMSGVRASEAHMDLMVSVGLAVILGVVWAFLSRSLSQAKQWAGWLALGVIIHPLAWIHSFVMAFPLAAMSIQRKNVLGCIGFVCVAMISRRTVGVELGSLLEVMSIRSWGVIFCAISLLVSEKATAASRA